MSSQAIIVLGMHRSGTSALTGVLRLLGVELGKALNPADSAVNPKGFWEHADIVAIHDRLLESLGSYWDDERPLPAGWWEKEDIRPFRDEIRNVLQRDLTGAVIWGLKDPRMCRLLPLWMALFQELACQPLFILALRDPAEVARSLNKRDGFTEPQSCLLWLAHMLEAEFLTRGRPRVVVPYEGLLADWRGTTDRISQALNLRWPLASEPTALRVDSFLDPTLRHHTGNIALPNHPACSLATEAYDLLVATELDLAKLDRLRARSAEFVDSLSPWSGPLQRSKSLSRQLSGSIIRLEIENAALKTEIARIKRTVSWRITAPFRGAWNLFKKCSETPPRGGHLG
jgi:hypothetical protein